VESLFTCQAAQEERHPPPLAARLKGHWRVVVASILEHIFDQIQFGFGEEVPLYRATWVARLR